MLLSIARPPNGRVNGGPRSPRAAAAPPPRSRTGNTSTAVLPHSLRRHPNTVPFRGTDLPEPLHSRRSASGSRTARSGRRADPEGLSVVRTGGIRALRSALARCPAVVGAIALASIVAGCRGSGAVPPDPASLATKVKVVVAQPRTVEDASEYVATIKSRSSATLQPQVEGQITRIFVKSGDRVEAGAPILQIDPLKQSATVSSQEATRKAKLATLDWTRAQLERAKGLFAQGITSKADLDQAQTALRRRAGRPVLPRGAGEGAGGPAQVLRRERAHGRHRRRRAGARGRPCHDLDRCSRRSTRGRASRPTSTSRSSGPRRCGSGRRSRSSTPTGRCWRSPGSASSRLRSTTSRSRSSSRRPSSRVEGGAAVVPVRPAPG